MVLTHVSTPLGVLNVANSTQPKNAPKTNPSLPTCCNCGGDHTASYRGRPYYKHVLETISDLKTNTNFPSSIKTSRPTQKPNSIQPKSYAKVAFNSAITDQPSPSTPHNPKSFCLTQVLELLKNLLQSLFQPKTQKIQQFL